jgi:hypothetical protein
MNFAEFFFVGYIQKNTKKLRRNYIEVHILKRKIFSFFSSGLSNNEFLSISFFSRLVERTVCIRNNLIQHFEFSRGFKLLIQKG